MSTYKRKGESPQRRARAPLLRLFRLGHINKAELYDQLYQKGGFSSTLELRQWVEKHTDRNYKPKQKFSREEFLSRDREKVHSNIATLEDVKVRQT